MYRRYRTIGLKTPESETLIKFRKYQILRLQVEGKHCCGIILMCTKNQMWVSTMETKKGIVVHCSKITHQQETNTND